MAERDDTITEIFVGAAVVIAAAGFSPMPPRRRAGWRAVRMPMS
jgi:hypothetical protein